MTACGPVDATPEPGTPAARTPRAAPPSASPTPEWTFTATPPPTPLPRYFTEEFEGSLPAWSVLQSNTDTAPQTTLRGGYLIFDLAEAYSWAYAVIGTETYADVRIDALAGSRAGSPEAIGVFCRYDEQAGWYEFNVSSDGTYNVLYGQWLAPNVARYIPIAIDHANSINPLGAQNEIGLACQGTTLWLYLNGKLFRKLNETRFSLTDGKIGLSIASFENTPVTAAFDRVRVAEPED
jgi:hypothetical protein